MEDSLLIVCACHSTEHQVVFYKGEEADGEKVVYMHTHLNKRPFWYRLKYGLKYILGRKCRYGAFDEIILTQDHRSKLETIAEALA